MASIFKKRKNAPVKEKETENPNLIVCPSCKNDLDKSKVVENKYVCYECGSYFRVRTSNRIKMVADAKSFTPWFDEMESKNPLDFPDYHEKIEADQEKTGLREGA